jgi:hypothetical protein
MSNGPFAFDPLWMFRGPFSGDVSQRITAPWFSPSLTVNYAGDPKIEDRVVTEVASYGRQLGWLTGIVLALAHKHPSPDDTLRRLQEASDKIEAIKKSVRQSALEEANAALDRLEHEQPDIYRLLLRERRDARKRTPPAS